MFIFQSIWLALLSLGVLGRAAHCVQLGLSEVHARLLGFSRQPADKQKYKSTQVLKAQTARGSLLVLACEGALSCKKVTCQSPQPASSPPSPSLWASFPRTSKG